MLVVAVNLLFVGSVRKVGGKYDKNDAAKDTRSSSSQVSSAWHTARDDAAGSDGVPADRHK